MYPKALLVVLAVVVVVVVTVVVLAAVVRARPMTMLRKLFGSETRVRLLARFLLHAEEEYYGRQVAALEGLRWRATLLELRNLWELGILGRRRSGNRLYYKANTSCPVHEELRSLLLKTAGLVDVLKETFTGIAPKLKAAFVYGSMARGEAHAGSDIDLFLVGSVKARALTSAVVSAQAALGRELNPTLLTVAELRNRLAHGDPFVQRVLDEPKLFVFGNEDELEALASRE